MERLKQEAKASRARAEAAKLGVSTPSNGDTKSPVNSPLPDRDINGTIVKIEEIDTKMSELPAQPVVNGASKRKVSYLYYIDHRAPFIVFGRARGIQLWRRAYRWQRRRCQLQSSRI